ncbi:hypothetical protein D018_3203B, partial [Vibrio parahaemolyticus VP2007-007]
KQKPCSPISRAF